MYPVWVLGLLSKPLIYTGVAIDSTNLLALALAASTVALLAIAYLSPLILGRRTV